ncbi:hypothetical protein QFC19_005788 [Naganishia cerealis]|uniref:Uncharacterized protein n=1 Tax=Naganishia cerealis TaxID=610337 RepID=A0ACC2VLR7_9TREE|nr:hypothetical protein QFC19_005788 [Naganishia cerealis]
MTCSAINHPFRAQSRVLALRAVASKPKHIPISSRSREAFRNGTSTSTDPSGDASGTLDVFHVYVKSPDLQIERPYTPINDVEKDGYIRLLVKRVKGGEVGEGDDVEIRGPIKTVSVPVHSLDHLTMSTGVNLGGFLFPLGQISTGTGVAPFLQLLCKVANRSKTATQTESPDSPQSVRPKLSLIQYLPRNGHAVPPTGNPSQTATESLPAEEFSELDSSSDAGPDIIRHPDVLSPLLRKQLTDAGALRLMRVRPGGTIDSPVLMDSLETTKKTEPAVENSVKSGEAQVSNGIGSWFSWLSSSNSDPQTDKAIPHSTVQEVKLRDGRLGDERAGVMICLPVK